MTFFQKLNYFRQVIELMENQSVDNQKKFFVISGKQNITGVPGLMKITIFLIGFLSSNAAAILLTNPLLLPSLSSNLSTALTSTTSISLSNSSTGLTNEGKVEIENFLQHSNTVHDIVQEEVKDALDRFTGILALLVTVSGVAGTYWISQTMKSQLRSVKEEMKSEFQAEFQSKSLELADATSGLLGLVVSMENIKFLSDPLFSPVSTESLQLIKQYPDILKNLEEHFKLPTLPAGFYIKLGDAISLMSKYEMVEAESNHDKQKKEEAIQKFNNAIDAYNKAFDLRGKEISSGHIFWADVFCKRGNAFAALGNYGRAIAEYKDALKIKDDCYWAIHSQGDAHAASGEYESAHCKYDEALKNLKALAVWRAETFYKKGILYAIQNEDCEAIKCYRESLKLNPNNSWVTHSLGDSLRKIGDYDGAIEQYKEALESNPRQYQSWRAWGDALCELENRDGYEDAITKYERASEITSEDGVGDYNIHNRIGDTYLRLGEYLDAIHHYNEAIELKSESFRLWACRAYAYEQLLQSEVLSDLERKTYEQNILSDRSIAKHNVHDKHHRLLRNHQNHSSEKAIAFYEHAICHALENNKEKAIQDLSQAIKLNSECRRWARKDIGFITIQSTSEFKNLVI